MAKLYAELTSDKGERIASKGGEKYINAIFYRKNTRVCTVAQLTDSVVIYDQKGNELTSIQLK